MKPPLSLLFPILFLATTILAADPCNDIEVEAALIDACDGRAGKSPSNPFSSIISLVLYHR